MPHTQGTSELYGWRVPYGVMTGGIVASFARKHFKENVEFHKDLLQVAYGAYKTTNSMSRELGRRAEVD